MSEIMAVLQESLFHATDKEYFSYYLRIVFALVLTSLIGIEREYHGRAAGLRTNVLVGVGATLFTIMSILIANETRVQNPGGMVAIPDPSRITAQIVSGIGFLGAGTIIKTGVSIQGLTTAACLWVVASIGIACGFGELQLALFTTILALISLMTMNVFGRLLPNHSYRTAVLVVDAGENPDDLVEHFKPFSKVQRFDVKKDFEAKTLTFTVVLRITKLSQADRVFSSIESNLLEKVSTIKSLDWQS